MAPAGPVFTIRKSATGVTVVMTGGVTPLVGTGSAVGEVTFATFVKATPLTGAVTVNVRLVACNAVRVPRFQTTTALLFEPLPLVLTKITPAGKASVTTTLAAVEGPRLVTLIV